MTTLPEEAVKAAYGAYVTFIEEGGAVPVIDAVRAAITAAAHHLAAVRVKAEPWGWIIPRGGSKKPVILEASKFDQTSAAAEADIHDLGYFPVYIHSAPASSEDIDPSRTEGFRQGIDAAAKLADYFEETIYSEGMSEEVYYGISCTVSQIAREIRALSSPDHADAGKVEGDGLPQDVINLVIAAREVWEEADTLSYHYDDEDFSQRVKALDKALEAFSERVPYENEPSAPASEGAE
ncbi:hypothetical protein [Brucella tritici]|uniref:hypothetical protein n=1 Tax=Brucella tritici TaxID=94626 RepID=UPI00200168E0|nr:hypothetical protein [Brucella tritici]